MRTRPRLLRLVPVLLVLALLAGTASAGEDVLVLQNGREIAGRLLEANDEHVKIGIGGGSITYPRSMVKEIRRGADEVAPEAPPPPPVQTGRPAREETALLYVDGKRAGTRVFRALERADGLQFEERITFLDAAGRRSLEVFTVERCDRAFRPTFLQIQETAAPRADSGEEGDAAPDAAATLQRLEVVGDRLEIERTQRGETSTESVSMPEGARLPFGAREEFLRSSAALGGASVVDVYDVRARRFVTVHYREGGEKSVPAAGRAARAVPVRVVKRKRGDREELEWIAADLHAVMTELNGASLRAMAAPQGVLDAVQGGDIDRVTGADSAARTRYADPVAGFAIGKPDPSWTFEPPAIPGASALVSVRSAPLGASVDVLRDEAAPAGVDLERAGAAVQRLLRAHSREFRLLSDGYEDVDGGRRYRLEAVAVTKGERTRTLAHVHVRDGRVYRLLAACPEASFDAARADLERVLASFEILTIRSTD